MGEREGLSVDLVYDKALEAGAMLDKKEFLKRYDERIARVYARSQITNGIDKLVNYLSAHTFKLAIVSASPVHWMEYVLPRLSFRSSIDEIVSIQDKGLQSKPAPDGYLEALRLLKVDAHRSIVLEDSNPGITSGKAAGCYVIGFRGNLIEGYVQTGADAYANSMEDVVELVTRFIRP